MKKIICKKVYDTESALLIKKTTFGYFGSDEGYEETLYQTDGGLYFLYVNGGEKSKHTKEDLIRMSAERAKVWLAENA